MPTVAISEATRKKLAELAAKEGKTVDEYVQDLLDRTVIRVKSAEDLIEKLGLEEIASPSPAHRARKRGGATSKKGPKR